jgi:hypothetical protein
VISWASDLCPVAGLVKKGARVTGQENHLGPTTDKHAPGRNRA